MGQFTKRFNKLIGRNKNTLTRFVYVPTLYPMGSVTFAVACSHCKNVGSEKCKECKCEIKSGFELKQEV